MLALLGLIKDFHSLTVRDSAGNIVFRVEAFGNGKAHCLRLDSYIQIIIGNWDSLLIFVVSPAASTQRALLPGARTLRRGAPNVLSSDDGKHTY